MKMATFAPGNGQDSSGVKVSSDLYVRKHLRHKAFSFSADENLDT